MMKSVSCILLFGPAASLAFVPNSLSGMKALNKPSTALNLLPPGTHDSSRRQSRVSLQSSMGEDETTNYDEEEILLKLHLSVREDVELGEAMERVSTYCQRFPFAAVLPVQPLQYLPTPDGGVDVRFMRKKTKEKGSLDGGIRFFVSEDRDGIDIVAKRNSQGQTVSKMFSEKLVVQSFVKRITGEDVDPTSPPPTDVVSMESVFHKWI